MKKKRITEGSIFSFCARFFEKALDLIKPSYMKLLVVFVVALLLVTLILKEHTSQNICIVIFAVVLLVFAILAGAVHYLEMKNHYSEETLEEFKKAIRERELDHLQVHKNDEKKERH